MPFLLGAAAALLQLREPSLLPWLRWFLTVVKYGRGLLEPATQGTTRPEPQGAAVAVHLR